MTKDSIKERIKAMPEIIENSILMNEPNSQIEIYKGEFIIKIDELEIKVVGEITFDWFPTPRTRFIGMNNQLNYSDLPDILLEDRISIIYNTVEIGKVILTNTNHSSKTNELVLRGILSDQAVLGDKSINVSSVRFSIPNLKEFHGTAIKTKELGFTMGRVEFRNENFVILLDKSYEYKYRSELLMRRGGYITLYTGELTSKKQSISFFETTQILHCFNTFLAFINGRRTSSIFLKGIYDEKEIWSDYSSYFNDIYKDVHSWTNMNDIDGLEQVWQEFYKIWQNEDHKTFLTSAIHWYVEANGHSGFTEGSIIMAQTALELIYNWWIIEKIGMIVGKDSDGISASNKIRLILTQLNISNKVPRAFTQLQLFIDNHDAIDGPDAIVQIRNAIVHSQEEKRKRLSSIHETAKYQALQLSIWYIEMSLLKILGYKNKFSNRCLDNSSRIEEYVPWV